MNKQYDFFWFEPTREFQIYNVETNSVVSACKSRDEALKKCRDLNSKTLYNINKKRVSQVALALVEAELELECVR